MLRLFDDNLSIFDDVIDGLFAVAIERFPNVNHHAVAAQGVDALKVGFDVAEGPLYLANGFAEVEEIGTVRDHMLNVVVFAVVFKGLGIIRVDRFDLPAPRRLRENLHGVAAVLFAGFLGCLRETAGNRHVGSKDKHGSSLRDKRCSLNPFLRIMTTMKVALVHDFLMKLGGAERVLEVFARMFPDAPLYTLLYDRDACGKVFDESRVRPSFLQRAPAGLRQRQRYMFPLMPRAIESFDLSEYDVVISSSNAYAHGVLTGSHALHICYCHSPMRYAWDYAHEYLHEQKIGPFKRAITERLVHDVRFWDQISADRPDVYIANSQHVRKRIKKYYRQPAEVLYPPVRTKKFKVSDHHEDYFLIVSALTPFKKIDLAVQLFNKIRKPLIVIGGGAQEEYLRSIAGPNVDIMGRKDDQTVTEYLQNCRAYIMPGEEDFGIAPVEAMACGKPVLAYGKGGVLETIIPGKTGELFREPTLESFEDALGRLIINEPQYKPRTIRKHANQFSEEQFVAGFQKMLSEKLSQMTNP